MSRTISVSVPLRRSRRLAGLEPIIYADPFKVRKSKTTMSIMCLNQIKEEVRAEISERAIRAAERIERRAEREREEQVALREPMPVRFEFNWRYLLCCWVWILMNFKW